MVTIKMLFFATLSTVTLGKNSFVNLYRIIILSSTAHQVSSQTDCSSLRQKFAKVLFLVANDTGHNNKDKKNSESDENYNVSLYSKRTC